MSLILFLKETKAALRPVASNFLVQMQRRSLFFSGDFMSSKLAARIGDVVVNAVTITGSATVFTGSRGGVPRFTCPGGVAVDHQKQQERF